MTKQLCKTAIVSFVMLRLFFIPNPRCVIPKKRSENCTQWSNYCLSSSEKKQSKWEKLGLAAWSSYTCFVFFAVVELWMLFFAYTWRISSYDLFNWLCFLLYAKWISLPIVNICLYQTKCFKLDVSFCLTCLSCCHLKGHFKS